VFFDSVYCNLKFENSSDIYLSNYLAWQLAIKIKIVLSLCTFLLKLLMTTQKQKQNIGLLNLIKFYNLFLDSLLLETLNGASWLATLAFFYPSTTSFLNLAITVFAGTSWIVFHLLLLKWPFGPPAFAKPLLYLSKTCS